MTPSAPQRSAARFVATFLLAGVIALGLAAWVFVAQPPPAASPRGGAQTTPTTQTGAARIALVVREVPHYAVEGERLEAALSLTLGPDAGKQDVSVSAFVGSAQVARVAGAVRGGEARAVDVSLGHVRAGAWPVEISAEGAEGSATVAWLLEVAPRPIRVLCVEARPRWEHRYFVDALLADAALRVQCVLLEADPEAVQKASVGVAPLTKLPEQFDDFDVVILGEAVAALTQEFMPREASWADRLRAWVRDQGGSVLLVAGEGGPYLGTSLEDLLPVACQRSEDEPTRFDVPFRLVLAREGLDSPLTRLAPDRERNREYWAADLPLHYWYRSGWAREGSHVLAGRELSGGATAPLIAWRSYGRGCVLWHGLDSLWRWRAEVGTRPFERYVGRAIRFLGVQAARVEGRAGTDAPRERRAPPPLGEGEVRLPAVGPWLDRILALQVEINGQVEAIVRAEHAPEELEPPVAQLARWQLDVRKEFGAFGDALREALRRRGRDASALRAVEVASMRVSATLRRLTGCLQGSDCTSALILGREAVASLRSLGVLLMADQPGYAMTRLRVFLGDARAACTQLRSRCEALREAGGSRRRHAQRVLGLASVAERLYVLLDQTEAAWKAATDAAPADELQRARGALRDVAERLGEGLLDEGTVRRVGAVGESLRAFSAEVAREVRALDEDAPAWFVALAPERRPQLPLPEGVRFGEAPGDYLNQADGSALVWVPQGASGLFLGKHEVTWRQVRWFRRWNKVHVAQLARLPAEPDHPAHCVSWGEANRYAQWVGARLPYEDEWDSAATWGRAVPAFGAARGNTLGTADGFWWPAPVGSFPAAPCGALDLEGNLSEWVADAVPAPGIPGDGGARDGVSWRKAKGSNWLTEAGAADGEVWRPGARSERVGFRIAIPW